MLAAPPPFPPSVLEGFVDSVAALPAEVTRLMSTMRDLDGKASALAGELDAMVAEIQAMPQGAKASKEQAEALKERRASFEKKQKDCVQLAIEKAEIAQRCLDLIDENALRLDAELQRHDHGLAEYRKRTGLSPDFPGGSGAPLDADLELAATNKQRGVARPAEKRPRAEATGAAAAPAQAPRPHKRVRVDGPAAGRAQPAVTATVQIGQHVAAHVRDPRDETVQWILARVERIHPQNQLEVVDDEAREAGDAHSTYLVGRDAVVPLPRSSDTKSGFPNLAAGSLVLAVYPSTTVFYRATVVQQARKTKGGEYGDYQLEFEDDSEEGSLEVPRRPVPFRHVVAAPSFMRR